jgi:hypothetical protein
MEGLPLTITETPAEVALDICRTPNRLATLERFINDSSCKFDRGTQTRRFRGAESGHRFERWTGGRCEARESTKPIERLTPDRPGIALAISCSYHQGNQFGIGERARALLVQSLTRAIRRCHQTPKARR